MTRWHRRSRSAAARLAPALVALLAVTGCRERSGANVNRPELEALAAALEAEPFRPVVGRLSGRFRYAPLRPTTRGATRPDSSPDVRIAVGGLEKLVRADARPAHRAALGVAYLAAGEWVEAVAALEEAVADAPDEASYRSDLAAAYLARAREQQRPDDWARALAAAYRAIALDPARPEARFNRALALQGMHLRRAEAEAWAAYIRLDGAGGWRGEADEYLATVRRRSPPSPAPDLEQRREHLEHELLPRWAAAVTEGRPSDAIAILADAQTRADALVADGGDAMARDEFARIRALERRGDRDALRRLARAHQRYARARQEYERENLHVASDAVTEAAREFRAVGSSYAYWAPALRATFLRHERRAAEAQQELAVALSVPLPEGYHNLRGSLAWMEGVVWGSLGRYDLEREPLRRALREFQAIGELDQVIGAQTLLAEVDWFLGDPVSAWANVLDVLALVNQYEIERGEPSRRNYHLSIGATIANGLGLTEAALELANIRVTVNDGPRAEGYGYLVRARLLTQLGDATAALADLERASAAFSRLPEESLRDGTAGDVDVAYAELLRRSDCQQAIRHVDAALPTFQRATHSMRVVGLLAIKARCRVELGDAQGANADLAAAIAAFEARRAGFSSPMTRIQAFEAERVAFKDLVALEAVVRGDERSGLAAAERERAGVLSAPWISSADATDHARLPAGTAVVYYEMLDDRVLTWVLTRAGRTMLTSRLRPGRLRRLVAQIQRDAERGADAEALRTSSRELVAELVAPALAIVDAGPRPSRPPTLVFVPDGPLFAVPFSALPDGDGQPLVRSRAVVVSYSLGAFHAASARLAGFAPSSVLAIGAGHDPVATGLPPLPHADREVARVAALYRTSILLAGRQATRQRVLRARADVVHFAGHTVVNERFPINSHLVLAPGDAGGRDDVRGADITADLFARTGVVVLASCEGAAGPVVAGEGALSIARTFFTAGVPAVVASLWPVPDDLGGFAETFHRELTGGRDAAEALRQAQLSVLSRGGPRTPVRVWGGFMLFGGVGRYRH